MRFLQVRAAFIATLMVAGFVGQTALAQYYPGYDMTPYMNMLNSAVQTSMDIMNAQQQAQARERERQEKEAAARAQAANNNAEAARFYEAGEKHFLNQEYPACVEELNRALTLRPDFLDATYTRGVCLLDINRCTEALLDFDKALKLATNKIQKAASFLYRGQAAACLGRQAEAMGDYVSAINADSGQDSINADAYFRIGILWDENKHYGNALEYYMKSIRLRNNQPGSLAHIWLRVCNVQIETEAFDEAISSCTKSIELDPSAPQPYYIRAVAKFDKGNRKGAIGDMRTASKMGLDYADKWLQEHVAK